jgi:hypothetical protein
MARMPRKRMELSSRDAMAFLHDERQLFYAAIGATSYRE